MSDAVKGTRYRVQVPILLFEVLDDGEMVACSLEDASPRARSAMARACWGAAWALSRSAEAVSILADIVEVVAGPGD